MYETSGLLVRNVSLSIEGENILRDTGLDIPVGRAVALLGTSGSGKTSFLRIIAGLQSAHTGRVFVDGRDVTDLPPEARGISMLFQQPALFPTKTIMENALAARRARRASRAEVNDSIAEISDMMDEFVLTRHKHKSVDKLSGGQLQRAAIVRCLANASRSKVLLLDEPFKSNLNASLRWSLMEWVKQWQQKQQMTCLLVTHEFAEAAFFADQVAVIDEDRGKIVVDTPTALFIKPSNLAIARIVGPANEWMLGKFDYKLPVSALEPIRIGKRKAEYCMCRYSSVTIDPRGAGFEVKSRILLGSTIRVDLMSLAVSGFTISAEIPVSSQSIVVGQKCGVEIQAQNVSFFDDRLDAIEIA